MHPLHGNSSIKTDSREFPCTFQLMDLTKGILGGQCSATTNEAKCKNFKGEETGERAERLREMGKGSDVMERVRKEFRPQIRPMFLLNKC